MSVVRRSLPALALACAALLLGAGAAQADVLGVDTSHWQHPSNQPISWNLLPSQGYRWAVMKAVQGISTTDPAFAQDWTAAGNAGLIRGAYDFANPTASTADAVAEAKHFVAVVGPLRSKNTLPPVLDLEVSNGLSPAQLVAWTKAWLTQAQASTGRKPIIYTGLYFWTSSMGNSTAFTGYPLWLAAYRSTSPPAPGGWPGYTMWQYTSTGRVTGVPAQVDLNRFAGTTTALSRLANGTASIGINPFGAATVTRTPAGIAVDGWAVDPDTAAPVKVTVAGSGTTTTVTASAASTYVGTTWPWYGSGHAFHVVLPAKAGATTVTVTAANLGAGADKLVASAPLTVGVAPVGTAVLTQTPAGVRAQGWAVDPDSALSVATHLTVDGVSVAAASAGLASTAAATAWPGYGTAHGVDVTGAIPTGTHTVCLTADNLGVGSGSTPIACTSVVKYGHPIGAVASPATAVPGGVTLTGWSLDDSSAAPTALAATVDGVAVAQGTAGLPSTAVPVAYSAYGAAHGFSLTVPVPAGTHDVCVIGLPIAKAGTPGQLGCTTVTRSSDPTGWASTLTVSNARVGVTGWVIDPDTAAPTTATMTVDGRRYSSVTASTSSAAAARAFPAWGHAHGYALRAYLPAGNHVVCVRGGNLDAGADANVGCHGVAVSPNPFGSVSAQVSGGTVTVSGWAADPSTARAINVRVYVDGHYVTTRAGSATGSPDLGVMGRAHAFTVALTPGHGTHTVAVFALNYGAGASIRIRSFTVTV